MEERLHAMLARDEIRQLQIQYCHFVRQRDVGALVGQFTRDGTFALDGGIGPIGLLSGDALVEMYEKGLPDIDPRPMTHNHLVTLTSPVTATGIVHVEFRLGNSGFRVMHIGTYSDDYAREGGVWKFRHRALTATAVVPG